MSKVKMCEHVCTCGCARRCVGVAGHSGPHAYKGHQHPTKRLSPYQRIMRNAKAGIGCNLSADEVEQLAMDDAIATTAMWDDKEDPGR